MSRRSTARTQRCSGADARRRFAQARKFYEVAKLSAGEADADYASVAAALAVLAGIAGLDAACCKALGRRARGQDHHDAEDLPRQIKPGGEQASGALKRLVDMKDDAHYGFYDVSGKDLQSAIRQVNVLIGFAEASLARSV